MSCRKRTKMDYHEIQAWRKLVEIFDRLYGSEVFDKEDYKSEPIVIKILNDFYYGDTGYIYLGAYIARYRSFEHFWNKFFQMKNKLSPSDPEKRKAPYGAKEREEKKKKKRSPNWEQGEIFTKEDFELDPADPNQQDEKK